MSRPTLTPETVIRRAADLADADGLAAVSLSAVARSFGVQAPSLYGHVRDLSAMRDGVSILALQELDELGGDAVAGRSQLTALRALCDVYRHYASSHPGRWEALQRRMGPDVVRSDAAARSGRTMAAVLRGYGIDEADRVHATRLLGAFVNGFVHLEHVGSFAHSEPGADASWAQLIGRLHVLLASWNSPEARTPAGEFS